jgi:hypothetical protein
MNVTFAEHLFDEYLGDLLRTNLIADSAESKQHPVKFGHATGLAHDCCEMVRILI